MKKVVLIWFLIANVFCFVTGAVGLARPWGMNIAPGADLQRIEDIVIFSQSALGGAVGSYTALVWTDQFIGAEAAYLRIGLGILVVQNLITYIMVFALAAVIDRRRSKRRLVEKEPLAPRRDRPIHREPIRWESAVRETSGYGADLSDCEDDGEAAFTGSDSFKKADTDTDSSVGRTG